MRTLILILSLLITNAYVFAQQGDNKKAKQQTGQDKQHLKLYPAEATDYVNVYVEYDEPADFVITIVGSPLNNERKWAIKAKTSYQQSIDVTQLPAGPYTITLDGGGVHEKAQFTVKR